MIEYIALTNFFSFKERTEFSLKATKEKPRGTLSGEDWGLNSREQSCSKPYSSWEITVQGKPIF